MEHKSSAKIVLVASGCILTVVLAMLAFVPFLNELLAVEAVSTEQPVITTAPMPETPQKVLVTAYYIMEENSKKISDIYIEVYTVGSTMVSYMRVPADTKVNLSEDLYKSLQTYAPELPQYLKLSNMAESFSAEYGLTGCNRILSEVLGVSLTEYVRADAEALEAWKKLQEEEKDSRLFFEGYTEWIENSASSRTTEERWMYYESRQAVASVMVELAPGSQEKDGYLLSGKRSKERLQELMLRTEAVPQEN